MVATLQQSGTSWDLRSITGSPIFTVFLCFFALIWLAIRHNSADWIAKRRG